MSRFIAFFIICILIKDTVLFGEGLSSGEGAKIVPRKFFGPWTALSRGHMAKSGDMVLSQNQIDASKKGLVPYEVIELRANQVYLRLGERLMMAFIC